MYSTINVEVVFESSFIEGNKFTCLVRLFCATVLKTFFSESAHGNIKQSEAIGLPTVMSLDIALSYNDGCHHGRMVYLHTTCCVFSRKKENL